MSNNVYDEAITTLSEGRRYFTIGPCRALGFERRFFKLEGYCTECAEMVTRIFLSLMACNDFYIELAEINKDNCHPYQKYKKTSIDLSDYSLPELGELLQSVLLQEENHLNLYFIQEKTLVTFYPDCYVIVYTPEDTSFTQLIESLVKQESFLYFMKYGDRKN